MNAGAPPAPPEAHVGDDGTGLRAALAIAVRGGLFAFVATAAVAQIPPLVIEIFGGGLALSTALKLGWFYELAFHRVGIVVSGTAGLRGASVRRVPHGDGVRRLDAVPGRASRGRGDIGIVRSLPRAGGCAGRTRLRAADRGDQRARRGAAGDRRHVRLRNRSVRGRGVAGVRLPGRRSAWSRAEPEARSESLPADARVSRVARGRLADAAGRTRACRRRACCCSRPSGRKV